MARVLFVCLHNAGRSQMSQVFFKQMAQGKHEARRMLSLTVEKIVLRCEGKRLVAQAAGSLAGMFVRKPGLC